MEMDQDHWRRAAALGALDLVRDGMTVGLGTGSTAAHMIVALGERVRAGLRVRGVATSARAEALARSAGIPLTTLDAVEQLDLTIDGADEITLPTLDALKGRGGALLHEKLVARATRLQVIAVDESKLVDRLGTRFPVPVE